MSYVVAHGLLSHLATSPPRRQFLADPPGPPTEKAIRRVGMTVTIFGRSGERDAEAMPKRCPCLIRFPDLNSINTDLR